MAQQKPTVDQTTASTHQLIQLRDEIQKNLERQGKRYGEDEIAEKLEEELKKGKIPLNNEIIIFMNQLCLIAGAGSLAHSMSGTTAQTTYCFLAETPDVLKRKLADDFYDSAIEKNKDPAKKNTALVFLAPYYIQTAYKSLSNSLKECKNDIDAINQCYTDTKDAIEGWWGKNAGSNIPLPDECKKFLTQIKIEELNVITNDCRARIAARQKKQPPINPYQYQPDKSQKELAQEKRQEVVFSLNKTPDEYNFIEICNAAINVYESLRPNIFYKLLAVFWPPLNKQINERERRINLLKTFIAEAPNSSKKSAHRSGTGPGTESMSRPPFSSPLEQRRHRTTDSPPNIDDIPRVHAGTKRLG